MKAAPAKFLFDDDFAPGQPSAPGVRPPSSIRSGLVTSANEQIKGSDPVGTDGYGVVVDSVNVSVVEYAPVRRASLAPMCCE